MQLLHVLSEDNVISKIKEKYEVLRTKYYKTWKQIWGGARDEEILHLLKKYKNKYKEDILVGN